MQRERQMRGVLGVLLGMTAAAAAACLLLRCGLFAGAAGAAGFLLGVGGYRLLAGQSSGFGIGLSALLTPFAALPGLWYAYARQIFLENEPFGCTMAEALELVPTVAFDPINRAQLLWDLGGVIVLDLLCAFLFAAYLRQNRRAGKYGYK